MNNPIAVAKSMIPRSSQIVAYLTQEDVSLLCETAKKRRKGERDALLIKTLFMTGLRISECLALRPKDIGEFEGSPVLYIHKGKGSKGRTIACPSTLAHQLRSYCYTKGIGLDEQVFPILRQTAWKKVKQIAEMAGLHKRVFPHLFRHSSAIFRLRQTDPRSLQIFLGHSSPLMTMRYLTTLTAEDAVRIQQEVEFEE